MESARLSYRSAIRGIDMSMRSADKDQEEQDCNDFRGQDMVRDAKIPKGFFADGSKCETLMHAKIYGGVHARHLFSTVRLATTWHNLKSFWTYAEDRLPEDRLGDSGTDSSVHGYDQKNDYSGRFTAK